MISLMCNADGTPMDYLILALIGIWQFYLRSIVITASAT